MLTQTKKLRYPGAAALGFFLAVNCQVTAKDMFLPVDSSIGIVEKTTLKLSAAPGIKAAKVRFSSVYTKINAAVCRSISDSSGDGDESPEICQGYRDYKIFVSSHGVVTQISIGREISAAVDSWDASVLPSFVANDANQIIEWRLANGEPFACIVRARYDRQIINPDEKGTVNEIVVKNLKGFVEINETIDAKKNADANREARRRADSAYLSVLK